MRKLSQTMRMNLLYSSFTLLPNCHQVVREFYHCEYRDREQRESLKAHKTYTLDGSTRAKCAKYKSFEADAYVCVERDSSSLILNRARGRLWGDYFQPCDTIIRPACAAAGAYLVCF